MTREELKKHCQKQIENCEMWARYTGEEPHGNVYEEHKLILELLEPEPCEDAVSRKAVLDAIKNNYRMAAIDAIEDLPSVTPKQRTGKWINAKVGKLFPSNDFKCSECGNILNFDGVNCGRGNANFCPNCGAKMGGESE